MRARFSVPLQTGPGDQPASCKMSTGSFPGVKSGRGVTLTPHPLLVPWSRKSRAMPLFPLWAAGLYRASVPVQGCSLPLPFIVITITVTVTTECHYCFAHFQSIHQHLCDKSPARPKTNCHKIYTIAHTLFQLSFLYS